MVCCWLSVSAQYSFDFFSISKITPDDGLSQGSNYFRFEDSCGFMWITANDALNRYDGKNVKVYNLDRYFNGCPNLQQGYGFAEDSQTNIYIGSTRGLYIYNRKTDKFSLQRIFRNSPDDVAMPFAFYQGKVWCFNRQFQIAAFDVKTCKSTVVAAFPFREIPSIHIYEMFGNVLYQHFPFVDKHGKVWVVGNQNLGCYDIATRKISFPLAAQISKQKTIFYSSFYSAKRNRLLLGTQCGIIDYDIAANKAKSIAAIDGKKIEKINNIAAQKDFIVVQSAEQGLFFCSNDFSLVNWIDPENNKYHRCNHYSFDKSGRLWVFDDGQGQIIFDFRRKLLNKASSSGGDLKGYFDSGVSTFAELPSGNVVVQNAFRFNISSAEINPIKGIQKGKFTRSCTDKARKGIWIVREFDDEPELAKKLFFYTENGSFKAMMNYSKYPELQQLQDMVVFDDGRLLTSFTSGLYWLDPEKSMVQKVRAVATKNPFKINRLSNNNVAVSYINNDMLLLQLEKGKAFKFVKKILPKVQSFYIQEDTVRHRYWVGTNQGIYVLNRSFNTIRKFDANNGLAGTYIYGLLLDDRGNAYCSHQRGISSINSETMKIINFEKSDGIQDWDFNNRAYYKASDGTMFFGGVSGFNYFKPPLIPYSFYKPEIYVDEIRVNGKPYAPERNADFIKKLNLDYTQDNIAIKAMVKDLGNANMRQLIYRIKEIDKEWKYLPNNSEMLFNSLRPDDYMLQLGTYDKYTDTEIFQKTILICIDSPFYKKNWFLFLLAFLLSALLIGLVYKRKLNRRQIAFEQQLALEKQRNKITADLHDDIGATLSSLQINSAVASRLIEKNDDAAKEVLYKIESQSQNLAERIGDIIWSMKPEKESFMSLSSRIKNFTNEILGSTNINYEIQIHDDIDTAIVDVAVRKNILLIAKEAINNIAKYSQATQVNITLQIIGNGIALEITDNGIGFADNEIRGNGITNMRKRTAELQGDFSIVSRKDLGTVIVVKVSNIP